MGLRILNRSGYSTEDLRRFVRRGLRACGVRGPVEVLVVSSPIRSRGCAEIGKRTCGPHRCTVATGRRVVLAVAAPGRTSHAEFVRRLARLLEHEAYHLRGYDHRQMSRERLYSLGATPAWARGARIRYEGRARDQMSAVRRASVEKPIDKQKLLLAMRRAGYDVRGGARRRHAKRIYRRSDGKFMGEMDAREAYSWLRKKRER